jgi:hypothetical protein
MNKEEFDQLAEGLLFQSETDAPLTYYELSQEKSQQWPPASGSDFLQLIEEDPAMTVKELAPERFFDQLRLGNEDREPQICALRQRFMEDLENTSGFRVGEIHSRTRQ